MRSNWSEKFKQTVRPALFRAFHGNKPSYHCPICNYTGPFKDKSIRDEPGKIRTDSKCYSCGATERHRLIHLVLNELAESESFKTKTVLHIAPEASLGNQLKSLFGKYETADLFMKNVDHVEDLQKMSFEDGAYDWVIISRVLPEPPDLQACLNQLRRIVKPGGAAIVAEIFSHPKTIEFGSIVNQRAREIGVDLIQMLEDRFNQVELRKGIHYPEEYQLLNRIKLNGKIHDDYPEVVRVPGVGFTDMLTICRV